VKDVFCGLYFVESIFCGLNILLEDVFCVAFFYPHLKLDRMLYLIEIVVLHERKMRLNFHFYGSPVWLLLCGFFGWNAGEGCAGGYESNVGGMFHFGDD
jgi:hypothetical protein